MERGQGRKEGRGGTLLTYLLGWMSVGYEGEKREEKRREGSATWKVIEDEVRSVALRSGAEI